MVMCIYYSNFLCICALITLNLFRRIIVRSTNGTQVNGEDLEPQAPVKLKEGDVVFMGSTEVKVSISDFDDLENVEEVSV